MAKIGVITFHDTLDNYGQVLQYLATQVFLESLGHEVYLLSLQPRHSKSFVVKVVKKILTQVKGKPRVILTEEDKAKSELFIKWKEITIRKEQEHPRYFENFRNRHFKQIKGTIPQLLNHGFDAFCVGSDQIWSSMNPTNMLGWVPSSFKRFSIASSIGHRDYKKDDVCRVTPFLKNFDFITVRDEKTVSFCNECGRNDVIKVLDPTFLLRSEQYSNISETPAVSSPYVFVYLLGGEISLQLSEILSFCKTNKLAVKYVESQGRCEPFESIPARIEEWIGLIEKASYVITNSYHGMCFSIIYKKPFLIMPLIGTMGCMNDRVMDLASIMGIENRIYTNELTSLFNPINWSNSDDVINKNRDWLKSKIELILK